MTHFQALRKFTNEYQSATSPWVAKPGWRVWRDQVLFHVTIYYGHAYLRHVQALALGRGAGTKAMRWLLELARGHGVSIIGHAGKFLGRKAPGPGVMALRRWYRGLGARFDRRGAFVFWAEGEVGR